MCDKLTKDSLEYLFKNHSKKIKIFLRSAKTKGENYDKFRDTGYSKTLSNPLFIKGVVRTISGSSLILKEMGLINTGAKQLLIKSNNVNFVKLSEKILIDETEYYIYNDAAGNKLQIFDLQFGYSRIIIFRKED